MFAADIYEELVKLSSSVETEPAASTSQKPPEPSMSLLFQPGGIHHLINFAAVASAIVRRVSQPSPSVGGLLWKSWGYFALGLGRLDGTDPTLFPGVSTDALQQIRILPQLYMREIEHLLSR